MLFDAPDFDAHEAVHFATDAATGLQTIIAEIGRASCRERVYLAV